MTPNVSVGAGPLSFAVGDFNGDGKQDLAVANFLNNNVSIRLGKCDPPPTIVAATGLSRQQGSPSANSQIATVTDDGGNGNVTVKVNNSTSATNNGVTVSNIVNTSGTITADIIANCPATNASFTLTATDSDGATNTANLNVAVTPNAAPVLTYQNQAVASGGSLTINPATGPSDNGSVSSIAVQSTGTYTGTISVDNTTGVVFVSNAAPTGTHTITIRATDSCGATTDTGFTLTVNKLDQTITFNPLGGKTFGDADFTVGATASSGLTVTFSTTGQCTVTGSTVHITGAGSCTIKASQAGSSNYNAAPDVSQSFTISQATPVIAWADPSSIVFGTPLSSTQLNATANVPGTFKYTPPAGTVLDVGVNQLSVTFTPTDAVNYTTAQRSVQLTVTPVTATAINLSSANYQVGEGDGHVAVVVNRTGDTTHTASVNYSTSDPAGLNDCDQFNGVASSRCDYATTVGTLQFAAGETSKTVFVPLVDDSYAEGQESFSITLSNPVGESLGAVSTATININDNDNTTGTNPLVNVNFFIRQQYIDFLGREPDPPGFAGWLDVLNNCGTKYPAPCDRIEVSSDFFRSPEFQDRGYLIYRFYVTIGRHPFYAEFMPDLAKVSGFLTDAQLEANKAAFVQEFMARSEFQTKYGTLTDPTAYVDALLNTVGLPNHPTRGNWITGLTNGSLTRAQVLRALVESAEVYTKYYNEAFVVMQYFGYLRRDPDALYTQWIDTLNRTGDYRTMINGFMNSVEYGKRFGP